MPLPFTCSAASLPSSMLAPSRLPEAWMLSAVATPVTTGAIASRSSSTCLRSILLGMPEPPPEDELCGSRASSPPSEVSESTSSARCSSSRIGDQTIFTCSRVAYVPAASSNSILSAVIIPPQWIDRPWVWTEFVTQGSNRSSNDARAGLTGISARASTRSAAGNTVRSRPQPGIRMLAPGRHRSRSCRCSAASPPAPHPRAGSDRSRCSKARPRPPQRHICQTG